MKKTLIAMTAVLAGSFALSSQAEMSISGSIGQALQIKTTKKTSPMGDQEKDINDGFADYTTIYISASEDIGNGMKVSGIYGLAINPNGAGKISDVRLYGAGTVSDYGARLSLSGGFGKITIGQLLDTPVRTVASDAGSWALDTLSFNSRTSTLGDVRITADGIVYSNTLPAGISVDIALLSNTVAVTSDGTHTGNQKSELIGNAGLRVAYSNAGIYAAFAMNSSKDEEYVDSKKSYDAFSLGYDAGVVNAKLTLANVKKEAGTNADGNAREETKFAATYLDLVAPLGNDTFHFGYGTSVSEKSGKEGNKKTIMGLEYVHQLSKSLKLVGGYENVDTKELNHVEDYKENENTIAVGLIYSF